jgi:hypothetical protein
VAPRQGDELTAGQQVRQATGQGRLGHAARAFDQHAADLRVDGGQAQREFQVIGADHGGEREMGVSVIVQSRSWSVISKAACQWLLM